MGEERKKERKGKGKWEDTRKGRKIAGGKDRKRETRLDQMGERKRKMKLIVKGGKEE